MILNNLIVYNIVEKLVNLSCVHSRLIPDHSRGMGCVCSPLAPYKVQRNAIQVLSVPLVLSLLQFTVEKILFHLILSQLYTCYYRPRFLKQALFSVIEQNYFWSINTSSLSKKSKLVMKFTNCIFYDAETEDITVSIIVNFAQVFSTVGRWR